MDITTHAVASGNFDSNLINNISKRLKNLYLEENNKNYIDRIWISRQSADKKKDIELKKYLISWMIMISK